MAVSDFMLGMETLAIGVLVFVAAGQVYRRVGSTGTKALIVLATGLVVFGLLVWQLDGLVPDPVFAALRGAYGGFIAAVVFVATLWIARTRLVQWFVRWYTRP